MPSLASTTAESPLSVLPNSTNSSFDIGSRKSNEKTISGVFAYTNGTNVETGLPDHRLEQIKTIRSGSQISLPNGNARPGRERAGSNTTTTPTPAISIKAAKATDYFGRTSTSIDAPSRASTVDSGPANLRMNGAATITESPVDLYPKQSVSGHELDHHQDVDDARNVPKAKYMSSPPALVPTDLNDPSRLEPLKTQDASRLQQRHTLNIPASVASTAARPSRDLSIITGASEEVVNSTGRFSPTRDNESSVMRRRRASLGLARRTTRTASDAKFDDVPLDEDAARWTEAIKAKRASRRRRLEEEDDERVIVGKKVEEGHANWVTAYNMLTGIRFTVSRTNAKPLGKLMDSDFDVKQKMSFDVMGSEQTPGSKYDFKFKDYAPQVFRSLRHHFGLDPADYLMSLTSKYILSELGSPGKSGSFFYFSRDYKYIIKTIHHAEHKLLRRVLRDYYSHVENNPNTLISQFYGLHRVKVAYGRKIHFVVMNNLFPPHRDIHRTFDLKGSTIGRDFKEENLESNPRAVLKDLNWLRRDMHLEFDQRLRQLFIEQLQRDVALLQRLHIMDYSLLVGIHDLSKGNDDNVREKTLQVFQPGGQREVEDLPGHLMRTPSRLESSRKARELRQTLRKEKPVPMGQGVAKMPDSLGADDQRNNRRFYNDNGGIRSSHEDGSEGEIIYYLGVIDCLTHYGFVKRIEHFWKGLSHNRHQISPIPPHAYGERFLNFMTGITLTKEEADRRTEQEKSQNPMTEVNAHNALHHHHIGSPVTADGERNPAIEIPPHSPRDEFAVEETLDAAQQSVDRQTSPKGRKRSEEEKPDRTLHTLTQTDPNHPTTLPVVQEGRETSSRNSSKIDTASHRTSNFSRKSSRESVANKKAPSIRDDQSIESQQDAPPARQSIEYTVTEEGKSTRDRQYHMQAPVRAETMDNIDFSSPGTKPSQPPRLDSGLIQPLSPLLRDDEIGIAR